MRTPDVEDSGEVSVLDDALRRLASPRLWLLFGVLFAALVILLVYLARGGGAPVQRFDYDLF